MKTKETQREKALSARRNLSTGQRALFSKNISEKLASLPWARDAKLILAYAATEDEADVSDFCLWAKENGKAVCYPVSYKGGIMEAYEPSDAAELKTGFLGIKAPDPEKSRLVAPEEIDLVIVPLVAFDEDRHRLGHGGGYSDRYLPKCSKATFVAVAFEAQKLKKIATDEHDILMDMLVTEEKMY